MSDVIQNLDFPHTLMQNKLAYCGTILRHLKSRPDLNLGSFGDLTLVFYTRWRSIIPKHLNTYYDILANLSSYIDKYADLAESCSKSGAYQVRRLECLERIKTIIHNLEQDSEVVAILKGMHNDGSFA